MRSFELKAKDYYGEVVINKGLREPQRIKLPALFFMMKFCRRNLYKMDDEI